MLPPSYFLFLSLRYECSLLYRSGCMAANCPDSSWYLPVTLPCCLHMFAHQRRWYRSHGILNCMLSSNATDRASRQLYCYWHRTSVTYAVLIIYCDCVPPPCNTTFNNKKQSVGYALSNAGEVRSARLHGGANQDYSRVRINLRIRHYSSARCHRWG